MILRKSAVQKEAINLAGLLANVNPQNLIKPDIHRRAVATNYDILEAFSGLRIGLRILINPKFFSHFVTSTREKVFSDNTTSVENYSTILSFWSISRPSGEFSDCIKKGSVYRSDHQQENQCYSPHVAAKSATGRGNPNTLRATQTPKASFFVSDHYAHQISGLVRTVSMVALVGLRSRRPVSFVSGISTPANVTAISERGNSGGDSLNTKEAAYMLATTPTQNPQFIWIIAAVRRDMPTITAKIHHIAAETEQEARRILARDHVCFFAGRIRTGGAHA
ncbi:TPA: host cell division inhibitor Icd-like protein [Klebsiella pneumoniae]|uniref:host cell division inhibitor Icd-like protein n=1 Tax=Enterobacteriaceae TaxID=543 RepID=UPI000D6A4CB4|nr:host cell division inhibitor Icd-like protein [Escherichia coli]HBX9791685.1 ash family protein [Klebsiella pneumoniae]HBX9803079.1 ash family protein [Klebsiella pneumoniae]HCC5870594.1 host cell division inhibitor Icd-like protein [Klebsiella pneumoniae]HCC6009059.1 host cell division inhibitor Icd-like protein [Klebsiella pneumoniae]HCC6069053.1 host cell division inhibitor Icd-like protein [Klebsiella pneumoniae]